MIYDVCEQLNDRLTTILQEFSRNSIDTRGLIVAKLFKARATSVRVTGSVEQSVLG